MLKQIRDLCLFMICGQTLLYFQSGKKYEKICRMILELLVLAGIVGMILNFLQSFGFQGGEMEAAGGAVAGMQRSMEEALSRQLGDEKFQEEFLSDNAFENLLDKYTMNEIKSKYNYFAEQYGLEIQDVRQNGEKLQVFLKEIRGEKTYDTGQAGSTDGKTQERELQDKAENEGNPAKNVEIEEIEIGKIEWGGEETGGTDLGKAEEYSGKSGIGEEELEMFRRQLALVFMMEEDKLEVILID